MNNDTKNSQVVTTKNEEGQTVVAIPESRAGESWPFRVNKEDIRKEIKKALCQATRYNIYSKDGDSVEEVHPEGPFVRYDEAVEAMVNSLFKEVTKHPCSI